MGRGPCGCDPELVAGHGQDVVHTDMGLGWPWAVPDPCGLLGMSPLLARDPLTSDDAVDLPLVEKLNENHTLIRKYPEVFLSIIGLSRTFVDTDVRLTLLIRDKNYRCWVTYMSVSVVFHFLFFIYAFCADYICFSDMGLLDFVKSVDPFMGKVGERTLAENELKETCGKKKRKVAFTAGPPPVKKARSGGIVISKPSPTTAGKTAAAMKKLITHSGQRDVGPGSVQDKNVRTRPAPDHFIVLTSGSKTLDTNVQTEADTVSPKVTSPIPYVQTEAEAVVAGFVNEIGTSSIPENEAGASSSSLGDGSPIDDFYESQTIDSATAHDIYIDAEFLDPLNVNSSQHRDAKVATLKSKLKRLEGEAANVLVLRRRVSELESTHDELKGQVSKLKADYVSLCDEIACVSKMRAEFMSIQVAKAQRFTERPAELDARIAELNYDMDTKLYPYIMTAAISMAINKEMQKGLEAGVEHGKASRSLSELEAYESGIAAEYVAAFNELEKVSFSLLDQLEVLKDSPLELLTSSLTLEGNHGDEDQTLEFRKLQSVFECIINVEVQEGLTPLTSLVVAYYHISSVAIVDDTVPSAKPHDDFFDTTVLDKLVDPYASTTSYGPSHLGPSFPPSFQWLASLLRYTKSPGLKGERSVSGAGFDHGVVCIHLRVLHGCKSLSDVEFVTLVLERVFSELLSVVRYNFS
ncbi:hypothetical protein Tco_0648534 [Tanacetum coccineum]